jgi:hypothetical protein
MRPGGPAQPPPGGVSAEHEVTVPPHIPEGKKDQALTDGFAAVQRTAGGLSVTDKSSPPNQVESLAQEYVEEAIADLSGQPPRYPSMSVLYNGETYTVEQRGGKMRVTGPQAGQSDVMAGVLKLALQQNTETSTDGFDPAVFQRCIELAGQPNQIRVITPQVQQEARVLAEAALFKSGFAGAIVPHVGGTDAATGMINTTFDQMRTHAATSRAIPFSGNPDPGTFQISPNARQGFGRVIRYLHEHPDDPAVKYAEGKQGSSQPAAREVPPAGARPSRPPEAATRVKGEIVPRTPAPPGKIHNPEEFWGPWSSPFFSSTYDRAHTTPSDPKNEQFAYAYAMTVWSLTPQGQAPTAATLREAQRIGHRFQENCTTETEHAAVTGLLKYLGSAPPQQASPKTGRAPPQRQPPGAPGPAQPGPPARRGQEFASAAGFRELPQDPRLQAMFFDAWEHAEFQRTYTSVLERQRAHPEATASEARQYAFGFAMTVYQLGRLGYDPNSQTRFISEHAEAFLAECSKEGGERVAIQKLLTNLSKIEAAKQEPPVPGPGQQMLPGGVALPQEEAFRPNPTLLPKEFPLGRLQDAAFNQTFMHAFDRDLHRTRIGVENWNEQQIAQFSFVYAVYISQGIPENDAGSKAHKFVNEFAPIPQEQQAAFISRHLLPPEFPQTAFEIPEFSSTFSEGLKSQYTSDDPKHVPFAYAYAAYSLKQDPLHATQSAEKFVQAFSNASPERQRELISQLNLPLAPEPVRVSRSPFSLQPGERVEEGEGPDETEEGEDLIVEEDETLEELGGDEDLPPPPEQQEPGVPPPLQYTQSLPQEFPQAAFEIPEFRDAFQEGLENPTIDAIYRDSPSNSAIFAFAYAAYIIDPENKQPGDTAPIVAGLKAQNFVETFSAASPEEKIDLISQLKLPQEPKPDRVPPPPFSLQPGELPREEAASTTTSTRSRQPPPSRPGIRHRIGPMPRTLTPSMLAGEGGVFPRGQPMQAMPPSGPEETPSLSGQPLEMVEGEEGDAAIEEDMPEDTGPAEEEASPPPPERLEVEGVAPPREQHMRVKSPGAESGKPEDLVEEQQVLAENAGEGEHLLGEDEDKLEEVLPPAPQQQESLQGLREEGPLPRSEATNRQEVKKGGENLWIELFSELSGDFPIPSDNPIFVEAFQIGLAYINRTEPNSSNDTKKNFAYAFAISVISNPETAIQFKTYIDKRKTTPYQPPNEAIRAAFIFDSHIRDADKKPEQLKVAIGQLFGSTLTRSETLPPPENLHLPQDFTGPWGNRDFLKFYHQGLTDVSVEGETDERRKAYAYAYATYAWNEPVLTPAVAVFSSPASKAARTFMGKIGSAEAGERKKLFSELLTRESTLVENIEPQPQPQTPAKPIPITREGSAIQPQHASPEVVFTHTGTKAVPILQTPSRESAQPISKTEGKGTSLPVANAVTPPLEFNLPPYFMAPWDVPFTEAFEEGLNSLLAQALSLAERKAYAFAYAAYKTTNQSEPKDAEKFADKAFWDISNAEPGKRETLIAGLFKPAQKDTPPPPQADERGQTPSIA